MANNSRNHLLASLSSDDFALLEPHLAAVTLELRKNLERPNRRIEAAYFPERGFASVVARQANGKEEIEVGLIGREGMTGTPICSAIIARLKPFTSRPLGTGDASERPIFVGQSRLADHFKADCSSSCRRSVCKQRRRRSATHD